MRFETIEAAVAATLLAGCAMPAVRGYTPIARTEPVPPAQAEQAVVESRDAVGAEALRRLQADPRVQERADRLMAQRRTSMRMVFNQSRNIVEMIQNELRREGVPADLAFLPMLESGFQPRAVGRSTAGLWQFTGPTARRYGLVVDRGRDDRHDPVKSSGAAARYLRDLYDQFGKWDLALAAYNAGEGRVQDALSRAPESSFWDLSARKLLPAITRDYVPTVLANLLVARKLVGPTDLREASLSKRLHS